MIPVVNHGHNGIANVIVEKKSYFRRKLDKGISAILWVLQKERASKANKTHGKADSRLYNIWCAIKRRCCNSNVPEYRLYGGRGISICDEWKGNYVAFEKWAINNGYDENAPRGECTIDRINNDGNYCPENCRWVSQQEQMNNVDYDHRIEYNGETHTIAEWARIYDMPYARLAQRINRYGYDFETAITK